jgi:hypothetical protein
MLFHVDFLTKILSESDNTFEVDGFINPTFYNDGESKVKINYQVINPGEYYRVDIPNGILRGKFNIEFVEEVGKKNLLIVNYGLYGGLFVNIQTGQILTNGPTVCN